jgi:hypothetical protein
MTDLITKAYLNLNRPDWAHSVAPKVLAEMRLYEQRERLQKALILIGSILLAGLICLFFARPVKAEIPSDEQIADAIYKAEGGAKTRHPYGILTKYKTTTPRQACINTIKHAKKDWNGQGDFIRFLQTRYAPIGVANDPRGLNKNWYSNVTKFLGAR